MAQTDGSIVIDTEINSDGLRAGGKEIETTLRKTANNLNDVSKEVKLTLNKQIDSFSKLNREYARQSEKVGELKRKVAEYGNQKIPTVEYKTLQEEIETTTGKMNELIKAQEWFASNGGDINSNTYKEQQRYVDEWANSIKNAKEKLIDLEKNGKAFKNSENVELPKADIEKLAVAEKELAAEEDKLTTINDRLNTSYMLIKNSIKDYGGAISSVSEKTGFLESMFNGVKIAAHTQTLILEKMGKVLRELPLNIVRKSADALKNSFLRLGNAIKGAFTNKISSILSRMKSGIFGINRASDKTSMSMGRMLKMSLLMSVAFRAFSLVMSGIKDGFDNLSQYSGETNNSLSSLWSSLVRLQNSLATAFAPILSIVAPILSKFIDMISTAASYVSMFFAFLSGKKTYTKAIAVQKDYAKSLDKTASSAKKDADSTKDVADATEDATDATEDYLSPLDDLNRYTEQQDKNNSGSKNPSSSTPNTGGGSGTSPMFEEVAISDIPILEKLKNILSKIFKPFKEAWDKEGKNTIDAAKYAFISLGELAKSVGKSFLEVWTNGTGTKTLTLMLQIAQNILLTVGNIAQRLNEAWNTNSIGTKIIQNIFNLLNIILGTIEKITADTAEWASKLNFTPLLNSINALLVALQPLTKNIGDGLEWLWKNILLPIAGWTITDALPSFLNMIASALNAINAVIELLKPLWDWFWNNVLKPVGVWTGQAFIDAMNKITDLLNQFSDWCSNNKAVVRGITEAVALFFAAWTGIEILSFIQQSGGLISTLGMIKDAIVGCTLAKLADKAETIALTAMYAKDFVVSLASGTAELIKQAAQFVINTGLKIADTAAQVAMTAATLAWNAVCVIATGLTTALGVAIGFLTSPIGLAIVAITAIIAAGVLLYKNWDVVKNKATELCDAVKVRFQQLSTWISSVFARDWSKQFGIIGDYMNGWTKNIKNIIDSIKQIFNGMVTFVSSVLSGNWRRAWEGIKQIFSGIWNTMASVIKSPVNLIISFMNAMLRGFQRMQNGFASAMNHMNIRLPKWLQDFTGWSSVGFNIGYWSPNYIPYLAKGAVIPPNKEFMAVLGDQKNGNNIEAPEILIRQIVREESGGGQKQRIEIPVYLKGKQIYKAVVEEGKVVMSQTGMNPFAMA